MQSIINKFYIYILLCSDGSLYTGLAKDINKRIEVHKSGKGSKYVRSRLPVKLIYSEEFNNKCDAAKRESEIKSWPRPKKISKLGLNL